MFLIHEQEAPERVKGKLKEKSGVCVRGVPMKILRSLKHLRRFTSKLKNGETTYIT